MAGEVGHLHIGGNRLPRRLDIHDLEGCRVLPGILHIVVDREVHALDPGLVVGHPHAEHIAKLPKRLQQKDVQPLEGVPAIALLPEGDPVLVGWQLVVDLGIILVLQHRNLGGDLVDR